MRANRRWTALAHERDGTVSNQRCNIANVAEMTAEIKEQVIPTMHHCGIGELGRHGSLINPEFSANFRPSFVTTDLPLISDAPLEFGVQEYCEACNLCRNNCPGDAIANDHIMTEGIKRWRIEMEKCYPYSRLHEAYCHICVDVCPYYYKASGNHEKRENFKVYMQQRKEDGYRSPNRL